MIQPPEHFKEQHAQFKEWFLSRYTSLDCVCIPFVSRHDPKPSLIHMETVMWDAWMSGYAKKTAEVKGVPVVQDLKPESAKAGKN